MRKLKSFGIFADLWDEDDVTTSITWGLCGYKPPKKTNTKTPRHKGTKTSS